jgi:hypothetical protein
MENFETEWRENEQDLKKLKALSKHYRNNALDELPKEFGYIQVMNEKVKKSFLSKEERVFLNYLCHVEGIDYTFKCYRKHSPREIRLNMFAEDMKYRMEIGPVDLGEMLRREA